MKISTSIKKICIKCRVLYRKQRLYRVCVVSKHKAHQ